ncbi:Type I restriction-modification system methyltransferase subunit [Yersinia intermedia]|uniref:N-6 DNA methylase n=1 Tax=Yersinia intermedia TaxID=631 RepID=UPI0005E5097F|nr:N-6 DNA methylase [Yersinia intermedia]CND14363.1 Type I restriction-modification system methyltransferase subunit [Yersinia intermedia]CNH41187.1 Type I restriction-modification system methyltransferase subunit [Yersinia intermedia]
MSQLSFTDLCSAFESVPVKAKPTLIEKPAHPVRMITPDMARKQFISAFAHTAQNMRRWDVFRDFITLAASELDMARIRTPENIERSCQICDCYTAADQDNMKKLFCLMVTALEGEFHDFLGSIFMELELGSDKMGQFFTPYNIQLMMAKMLTGDIAAVVQKQGWIELYEPACGAAGMVLAYAQCMLEAGLNPSEHLYVECIDIDPVAADIAFIQLSLLGIPARVITGDVLTMKFTRVRYTPIYYLNEWENRLALQKRVAALVKVMQQATKTAL